MQYDTISEVYDRFNDGFDYEKYLNTVFRRFHPRETGLVLDCGCGTGVLMEILTQRGYDCTGVDVSERMLEGARERFEKNGIPVSCRILPLLSRSWDYWNRVCIPLCLHPLLP